MTPSEIRQLIDSLGGYRKLAERIGQYPSLTYKWHRVGRIPKWRIPEVRQAARRARVAWPKGTEA